MARYIDAEYVLERLAFYIEDIGYEERINKRYSRITVEDAMALVEDAPTADVRPVKHGHWIEEGDIQICSECGEEHCWQDYRASYCEDCGAKMDGEEED